MRTVDISDALASHKRFLSAHQHMVGSALNDAGRFAADHVRNFSTFKRRSGSRSLKDSVRSRVIRTSTGKVVRLTSRKKHAAFIEYGTRPHTITGTPLRFVVGGRVIYTRRVNHPGTRPYKFLWKATHAAHRLLDTWLSDGMRAVARKF